MTRRLSRRTFLRGSGVALALPLLEAMTAPGFSAVGRNAPVRRRMVSICTTLGLHPPNLYPKGTGHDYESTPYLDVLGAVRDDLTLFSGLSHPEVDGGHSSESSFLTAAPHPAYNGFKNSISLDQFAAERLDCETRFTSLVLCSGSLNRDSLSWTRNGVMIPAEALPSKVFAKLFLTGTPTEVRDQVRRLRDGQSILDTVGARAARLQRTVGRADQEKLDQYLTSVRELEQRLGRSEEWATKPKPVVESAPPNDIANKADILGRMRSMCDLIQLAFVTDSTRLITLQIQGTGLVPPLEGISIDHHHLTHHGKDPEKISQLGLLEREILRIYGDLIRKLKETQEEGESLLDRSMVLLGSNLGNANSHDTKNLPIFLAGGGFKHGQHVGFDQQNNMPLCNLYLSMLQRLGVEVDRFASSTGTLRGLETV